MDVFKKEKIPRCHDCGQPMIKIGDVLESPEDYDNDMLAEYVVFYQCPECKEVKIQREK